VKKICSRSRERHSKQIEGFGYEHDPWGRGFAAGKKKDLIAKKTLMQIMKGRAEHGQEGGRQFEVQYFFDSYFPCRKVSGPQVGQGTVLIEPGSRYYKRDVLGTKDA